jgi:hypothetical protein
LPANLLQRGTNYQAAAQVSGIFEQQAAESNHYFVSRPPPLPNRLTVDDSETASIWLQACPSWPGLPRHGR